MPLEEGEARGAIVANSKRVKLREVNAHLACVLCKGYLVDATTIIECMHSFCRTCIVRYLETSKFCPICDVLVHKTKPLLHIRPDKMLQALVYKIVPGLFHSEVRKRREFWAKTREPAVGSGGGVLTPEEEAEEEEEEREEVAAGAGGGSFFSAEDSISLSLEYYDSERAAAEEEDDEEEDDEEDETEEETETKRKTKPLVVVEGNKDDSDQMKVVRRYLKCPAAVTMLHLKKFIRMKYGLCEENRVDVIYKDECLPDEFSLMDVAYTFSWRRKRPMRFSYRIFKKPKPPVRRRVLRSITANGPQTVVSSEGEGNTEEGSEESMKGGDSHAEENNEEARMEEGKMEEEGEKQEEKGEKETPPTREKPEEEEEEKEKITVEENGRVEEEEKAELENEEEAEEVIEVEKEEKSRKRKAEETIEPPSKLKRLDEEEKVEEEEELKIEVEQDTEMIERAVENDVEEVEEEVEEEEAEVESRGMKTPDMSSSEREDITSGSSPGSSFRLVLEDDPDDEEDALDRLILEDSVDEDEKKEDVKQEEEDNTPAKEGDSQNEEHEEHENEEEPSKPSSPPPQPTPPPTPEKVEEAKEEEEENKKQENAKVVIEKVGSRKQQSVKGAPAAKSTAPSVKPNPAVVSKVSQTVQKVQTASAKPAAGNPTVKNSSVTAAKVIPPVKINSNMVKNSAAVTVKASIAATVGPAKQPSSPPKTVSAPIKTIPISNKTTLTTTKPTNVGSKTTSPTNKTINNIIKPSNSISKVSPTSSAKTVSSNPIKSNPPQLKSPIPERSGTIGVSKQQPSANTKTSTTTAPAKTNQLSAASKPNTAPSSVKSSPPPSNSKPNPNPTSGKSNTSPTNNKPSLPISKSSPTSAKSSPVSTIPKPNQVSTNKTQAPSTNKILPAGKPNNVSASAQKTISQATNNAQGKFNTSSGKISASQPAKVTSNQMQKTGQHNSPVRSSGSPTPKSQTPNTQIKASNSATQPKSNNSGTGNPTPHTTPPMPGLAAIKRKLPEGTTVRRSSRDSSLEKKDASTDIQPPPTKKKKKNSKGDKASRNAERGFGSPNFPSSFKRVGNHVQLPAMLTKPRVGKASPSGEDSAIIHDDYGALDLSGRSSRKSESPPATVSPTSASPSAPVASSPNHKPAGTPPLPPPSPSKSPKIVQSPHSILSIAQTLVNRQLSSRGSGGKSPARDSPTPPLPPKTPPRGQNSGNQKMASPTPQVQQNTSSSPGSPRQPPPAAAMSNLMTLTDTAVQIRNLMAAQRAATVRFPEPVNSSQGNPPAAHPRPTGAPIRSTNPSLMSPLRIPVPPVSHHHQQQQRNPRPVIPSPPSPSLPSENGGHSLPRTIAGVSVNGRGGRGNGNFRGRGSGPMPRLHELFPGGKPGPNQGVRQIPNPSLLTQPQNRMQGMGRGQQDHIHHPQLSIQPTSLHHQFQQQLQQHQQARRGGIGQPKPTYSSPNPRAPPCQQHQGGGNQSNMAPSSIRNIENLTRSIEKVAAGLSVRAVESRSK